MIAVPDALVLLGRVVVAVLAVYHFASGLLALLAPARARSLMRALYAAEVQASPQMDYAVAMIGAQALAIAALATAATFAPLEHRAIIGALALLQFIRAVVRVVRRGTLRESLGVPPSRNAIAIALLLVEAALLLALCTGVNAGSAVGTA